MILFTNNMRFLVRIQPTVEGGNKMMTEKNGLKNLQAFYKQIKGENAFFYEQGGLRTFEFIVNMSSVDQIPSIAEPMFQAFNAKVEFHPVMLFEDLEKSFSKKK